VEADCIGCSLCELACDVYVPHEFDYKLGARRAIYIPHANAIPRWRFWTPSTASSTAAAPRSAQGLHRLRPAAEEHTVEAGTVIVTSGLQITPMNAKKEYGGDKYVNVMNPLAMERVQAPTDPTATCSALRRQGAQVGRLRAVRR